MAGRDGREPRSEAGSGGIAGNGGRAAANSAAESGGAKAKVSLKVPAVMSSVTAGGEADVLSPYFGILCDASEIQRRELARLATLTSRAGSPADIRRSAESHVLLGLHKEASQMFLEMDAQEPTFYTDSLRACLVSAVSDPAGATGTIKMVA